MSRLEGFIRRMIAQRDCINYIASKLGKDSGPILELGFGNGRTYDHISEKFPHHEVYVIDRNFGSNVDIIRNKNNMLKGEIQEIIPAINKVIGGEKFLFIHSDIGGLVYDNPDADMEIRIFLSNELPKIIKNEGMILSNLKLSSSELERIANPPGIREDKIFMYNKNMS